MALITSRIFYTGLVAVLAAATLVACAPLQTLNALTPESTYHRVADIQYGEHPRQRLDIYVPANKAGPLPVAVFFYGGSWNSGDRGDYLFVGEALASRGIIAVVADYRLYPEVRYPEFLDDSAAAVAWTAKHIRRVGGDPRRLYVMGHSAGAYNAAMLALDPRFLAKYGMAPSDLTGWVGLAGPYDFIPIQNKEVRPVFFYPATPPASQPINHVSPNDPPALLIAPSDDDLVNPDRNTGGLAMRLREAGVPVHVHYFDKVSHPILIATLARPLRILAPTLDLIDTFVETSAGRQAPSVAINR